MLTDEYKREAFWIALILGSGVSLLANSFTVFLAVLFLIYGILYTGAFITDKLAEISE